MCKLNIFAAVAAAGLFAVPATAHPQDEFGSYVPRGPTTTEVAQEAISNMVTQKKLPATWMNAKLLSFDYRAKNGVDQYVLTFENPAIKQKAKRKLFVVMGMNNRVISTGYKLV